MRGVAGASTSGRLIDPFELRFPLERRHQADNQAQQTLISRHAFGKSVFANLQLGLIARPRGGRGVIAVVAAVWMFENEWNRRSKVHKQDPGGVCARSFTSLSYWAHLWTSEDDYSMYLVPWRIYATFGYKCLCT